MNRSIKKESNQLNRTLQKDFVCRLLLDSGFPPSKKAYIRNRNGVLIVRFDKKHHEYY